MYKVGLAIMVLVGIGQSQQTDIERRTDFSGRWELNAHRSVGISQNMVNVRSFVMDVNESYDSMIVQTSESSISGQVVRYPAEIYRFDGSEFHQNDSLRATGRWIKAEWATTRQKMVATEHVEIQPPDAKASSSYTETDVWQFTNEQTLMIIVTQKFLDGSVHNERRYFHRVP